MIERAIHLAAITLWIGLLGCNGPTLVFPGGALEGKASPPPESWAFTDAIDTIQLETQPSDPYSVNIWIVAHAGDLYVHAGANRATWIEHMEADPSVRLGVDGAIYALVGSRVTDQAEFDEFADAYEAKYGRRPRNEQVDEAYLFRLSAP